MSSSKDFLSKESIVHFNPTIIEKQIMKSYPSVVRKYPINPKLKDKNFKQAESKKLFNFGAAIKMEDERIHVSKDDAELEDINEKPENSSANEVVSKPIETKTIKIDHTVVKTAAEIKQIENNDTECFEFNLPSQDKFENEFKDKVIEEWKFIHANPSKMYTVHDLINPNIFVMVCANANDLGLDTVIIDEALESLLGSEADVNHRNIQSKAKDNIINTKILGKSAIFSVLQTIVTLSNQASSTAIKEAEHTKTQIEKTGTIDSENKKSNGIFSTLSKLAKKAKKFF
jgi:hypothetical protein